MGVLEPLEPAIWLRGYRAVYFNAMDAWFDEDEEIEGNLRDPYHRVDVRDSSRHIRVLFDGEVVAESSRPKVLSETGVPNRYYLPPDDVHRRVLEPSATRTVCPYKGRASYCSLHLNGRRINDAAWFYPAPLESVFKVAHHFCFAGDDVEVEVDGKPERGGNCRDTDVDVPKLHELGAAAVLRPGTSNDEVVDAVQRVIRQTRERTSSSPRA